MVGGSEGKEEAFAPASSTALGAIETAFCISSGVLMTGNSDPSLE